MIDPDTKTITPTIYLLDQQDVIQSVGGPWDEFAAENDGEQVYEEKVCGRSIWDFVHDATTRMWLSAVLQLSRVHNLKVERPYRCDSPELRRNMMMRIFPQQQGILRVEHELVSMEKRPEPVYIHHAYDNRLAEILFRCSVCGRVNLDEEWVEPEAACTADPASCHIHVEYSVCGECH
jgi:hypothetical protein